jgi:dihydrofolate synthase / folylpolyglutamate synthase
VIGGAREAAGVFLGRSVEPAEAQLPGRLEIRGSEVWDGAHTPGAVDWLLARLPEPADYVVVASILGDKDADGILERLRRAGSTLVATQSSNNRALPAGEVAARARTSFPTVMTADDPHDALRLARTLGPRVLVTGSLYLLADLSDDE